MFCGGSCPAALIERQLLVWEPVLRWAAGDRGAHFILTEGVTHVAQPNPAIADAQLKLPNAPWLVAALHIVTTITGSALLALALTHAHQRKGAPDAR
mgnify:CR=1 FL=1